MERENLNLMANKAPGDGRSRQAPLRGVVALAAMLACAAAGLALQAQAPSTAAVTQRQFDGQTTQDYNRRLDELRQMLEPQPPLPRTEEYRIGPEDLLEITVFEAPELNRTERVSASGEVSLPLLGPVKTTGVTPRQLEIVLQALLRRTYMKDPHVGVFVKEMESHPVSVFGAVKKPGVFQIRGTKTVVELLSLAQGLAEDAGDTVLVMRSSGHGRLALPEDAAARRAALLPEAAGASPAATEASATPAGSETIEIPLKQLLASGETIWNVPVYPGDVIKVARAGVVYVVGEVKKPGGFLLKSNENISVLQALALAEGLTRTSAKSRARIIRTEEATGKRSETPIDLEKILAGKAEDPILQPKDIVFIPNSSARSGFYRAGEAAISTISGIIVFRR